MGSQGVGETGRLVQEQVYRPQWQRREFKSYPSGTLVSYVDVVQFLVKCNKHAKVVE